MGFLVCGGSPTQCSFGMTPSVLNVTPENKVLGNAPIACMNDNIVMKNIMCLECACLCRILWWQLRQLRL